MYNNYSGYGPQGPYQQPNPQGPQYNPSPKTQDFISSIRVCFEKYVDFTGRASRAEFWWFVLFCVLVDAALSFLPWLSCIAGVALTCPMLAVSWRRLHDIGRGGGYFFIGWIPIVGQILMIIWFCRQGEMHPNRFGPNPYGYNDGQPPLQY